MLRPSRYALAFAMIAFVAVIAGRQVSAYARLSPLGLRESSRVRTTERQVAGIRWLVANIEQACTTFLSPTGFNSLYLWADKKPASRVVIPNQVYMFSEAQQRVLLDSLKASPKPLVAYHDNYFTSREQAAAFPKNLLLEGMLQDFRPFGPGTVEGFALRYKSGMPAPEMVEFAAWQGASVGPTRTAEIHIEPKPGRALDRITIAVVGGMSIADYRSVPTPPDVIIADSAVGSTASRIEVLGEAGDPIQWPLSLDARRRLTITFAGTPKTSWEPLVVARLLDRDGQWITSIPFITPFPARELAVSRSHEHR